MPVLHTYRSKEGQYVLAGVNGRIVTYRLSQEGVRRLQENSITDGGKFSWAILLELIRQGDAYTGNAGEQDEDLSGWTQLGLLFNIKENEPSTADLVPLCSCGSMEGLHIAELAASKTASLLCDACRTSRRDQIDASLPIYLVNNAESLQRFLSVAGLTPDKSLEGYRDLLESKHSEKWDKIVRKRRAASQAPLFPVAESEQENLL